MALIVQGLIAMHIIALFIYYGGDAIAQAWKDDDGDGIPNFADPDYKKGKGNNRQQQNQPMHSNAAETELIQLREENARLKASQKPTENPTDGGTK